MVLPLSWNADSVTASRLLPLRFYCEGLAGPLLPSGNDRWPTEENDLSYPLQVRGRIEGIV